MSKGTCSIEGCGYDHYGRGLCKLHWQRWARAGRPEDRPRSRKRRGICTIENCERPEKARGWCQIHYTRWRKHGDAHHVERIYGDDETRFWMKVDKSGSCWMWTRALNHDGYGWFGVGRTAVLAHRWAYEHLVGPIPNGLELDHLCRVRSCVNPSHLEAVVHRENVIRGEAGQHFGNRTHCPQGHPYSGDNLYVDYQGHRLCRVCRKAQRHRSRTRMSEKF